MNQIGAQSGQIILTLGGLVLFGLLYANLVNYLHRLGYSEGYTALLVVLGTLITLLADTTIHQTDPILDFLLTLACFAASGAPMAINDWWQYVRARGREQHILADTEDKGATP